MLDEMSDFSEGIGRDHLSAGLGAEGPPGLLVDRVLDEPDRSVGEEDIHTTGMETPARRGGVWSPPAVRAA
jgi:hypothetical protein